MWTPPPTVDDSNHHIFVHSFRPIPTSPPSVPLSPSSSHSSFTIFTVSLSGSVVETCHSGLPKGRTLVLPFTLCQQNKTKTISLKPLPFEIFWMCGAAGAELTHRLAQHKTTSGYIYTHAANNLSQVIRH